MRGTREREREREMTTYTRVTAYMTTDLSFVWEELLVVSPKGRTIPRRAVGRRVCSGLKKRREKKRKRDKALT